MLDGEMRLPTLQRRSLDIHKHYGADNGRLLLLARHQFREARQAFPNLRAPKERKFVLDVAKDCGVEVLIADNISVLFPGGGSENDPAYWGDVEHFIFDCQDQGIMPVMIHHAPKGNSKSPAGSSKNVRVSETVLVLSRVEGGTASECYFNVETGKDREASPDLQPLSARFGINPLTGVMEWTVGPYVSGTKDDNSVVLRAAASAMHQRGQSYRAIGKELGINKSQVGRLLGEEGDEVDDEG